MGELQVEGVEGDAYDATVVALLELSAETLQAMPCWCDRLDLEALGAPFCPICAAQWVKGQFDYLRALKAQHDDALGL